MLPFLFFSLFPLPLPLVLFSLYRVLRDIILPVIYKAIKQHRRISEASPNIHIAGNRRYELEKWKEASDAIARARINISAVY